MSQEPETGCSVLNKLSTDEAGNIYLSTWLYGATLHQLADAAPTCARRIRSGETSIDPSWRLDYPELTAGRQGGELSYVADGKAILSVFHHERAVVPADADPWSMAGTPNWRVWSVDLEARAARPIEDIEWSAGDHVTFESERASLAAAVVCAWLTLESLSRASWYLREQEPRAALPAQATRSRLRTRSGDRADMACATAFCRARQRRQKPCQVQGRAAESDEAASSTCSRRPLVS